MNKCCKENCLKDASGKCAAVGCSCQAEPKRCCIEGCNGRRVTTPDLCRQLDCPNCHQAKPEEKLEGYVSCRLAHPTGFCEHPLSTLAALPVENECNHPYVDPVKWQCTVCKFSPSPVQEKVGDDPNVCYLSSSGDRHAQNCPVWENTMCLNCAKHKAEGKCVEYFCTCAPKKGKEDFTYATPLPHEPSITTNPPVQEKECDCNAKGFHTEECLIAQGIMPCSSPPESWEVDFDKKFVMKYNTPDGVIDLMRPKTREEKGYCVGGIFADELKSFIAAKIKEERERILKNHREICIPVNAEEARASARKETLDSLIEKIKERREVLVELVNKFNYDIDKNRLDEVDQFLSLLTPPTE